MTDNSQQSELCFGEFNLLAKQRFSCRSFADKEIPSDILRKVLEAACLAPSALNTQYCSLHLVKNPKSHEMFNDIRDWYGAAAVVLVCVPHKASFTRVQDHQNYNLVDLGILLSHLALSATSHGLGSCIIASFDPNEVRAALQIPMDVSPVIALALGYPDENGVPSNMHKARFSLEQRLLPNSDQP